LSTGEDADHTDAKAESILGGIVATARLDIGRSERVRLFATSARLIVGQLGKRGAGALAASPILGRFSGGFEELLKGGLESRKRKTLDTSSPQDLLSDRDNFDIPYDEIVQVELEDQGGMMNIMILTKDQKLQFVTLAESEAVRGLFHPLQERLIVKRHNR
jgi:hypothetical protein